MSYSTQQPTPDAVAQMKGPVVLDFGTNWCGICRAARNDITEGLGDDVPHLMVEDGPGRPLGRSFRVKLWPTLIFLQDGVEVARVVRPRSADEVARAKEALDLRSYRQPLVPRAH